MEKNEITTLKSIAETLRVQLYAIQRTLAKNADMSAALMNAVLKRFVERGWIMLSSVNKRKLAYAVTPAGLNELAARGKKFVVRTFRIAHTYNEALTEEIALAKQQGKNKVVLYGESYIKFLLEYASRENQLSFEIRSATESPKIEKDAFCIAGEMNDESVQKKLIAAGCTDVLDIVRNASLSF